MESGEEIRSKFMGYLAEIASGLDTFADDQIAFQRFGDSRRYKDECKNRADAYRSSASFVRECAEKIRGDL